MHLQPQKGIPPAIPKDPIDDHETYLCPRTLQKKSTPIFYDCRPPPFTFCNCESIHFKTALNFKTFRIYPQNFHLDISKYRQIEICEKPKIHSSY